MPHLRPRVSMSSPRPCMMDGSLLCMESWKPVTGTDGRYEVSDQGNVRSLVRPGEPRPLRPFPHPRSGHLMIGVCHEAGERKRNRYVHRMLLEAFVGPAPDGYESCHRDGEPSNNTLGNLYWGTKSDNRRDSVKHGTHVQAKKTHCPRGHEYDSVRYRRSGPKAGQSFRACSICENAPRNREKEQ